MSQFGERLWEDYQAFAQRDLSEYEIGYPARAWPQAAIARRRPPGLLLHLMAGSKEDARR